jgi:hypothetical protein
MRLLTKFRKSPVWLQLVDGKISMQGTSEFGVVPAAIDHFLQSASKPIDLGLGFQVHWVHIRLGFPAYTLVGTSNG